MRLPDEDVYGEIMQQADVSALRLFEALVVTLPETLLQTYVLICTDIGLKSPGRGRKRLNMKCSKCAKVIRLQKACSQLLFESAPIFTSSVYLQPFSV